MDLLEYQVKELFRTAGIPTLPAQRIDHPKDIKNLTIPYPVALKSQVQSRNRTEAGGIKVVANTIDAIAAAQLIFNLPIQGEYPQVLLAEATCDLEEQLYLAIALSSSARRPILLGAKLKPDPKETQLPPLHQVVVEQEFSPFYARRLAIKVGLTGSQIQTVSTIVEKMYQLFVEKDLDLLEINALGIGVNGEMMALEGRISINDGAVSRHQDLITLIGELPSARVWAQPTDLGAMPTCPFPFTPSLTKLTGTIGVVCNGAGLTMATLDAIFQAGGKPANFFNLGGECSADYCAALLCDRLRQGLEQVLNDGTVKVILINLLTGLVANPEVTKTVTTTLVNHQQATSSQIPVVLRLVGQRSKLVIPAALKTSLQIVETLEEAVQKAISLGTIVDG